MSEGSSTHRARVIWTKEGARPDLRAHTVDLGGQAISGSCAAALGGNPGRVDPEQLFVASLAACHMLWFLDFARRERVRVLAYSDEAEGTLGARRLSRVVLRPAVHFADRPPAELIEELHARAHAACFIARSVSCPVEVEWLHAEAETA